MSLGKILAITVLLISAFFVCRFISLNSLQIVSVIIFLATVAGTLLFWEFHLPIAFIGVSIFFLTGTLDVKHFISSASLNLILFLIGMMILVGVLREANFFTWLLEKLLLIKNLNGLKLILILIAFSSLLSCLIGQVTTIIFITFLVFEICALLEINPLPLIMVSVIATNIGSAGTLLGNPVGILLATREGLTFGESFIWCFPVMLSCAGITALFVIFWYRREIKEIDNRMQQIGLRSPLFRHLIEVEAPSTREIKEEIAILAGILICLILHRNLESLLGLAPHTLLVAIPLLGAGLITGWKRNEIRKYIEEHVDWWTIIFFILFFAKAGALEYTGVSEFISRFLQGQARIKPGILLSEVIWLSSLSSSIMDNVVVASILIPVIEALENSGMAVYHLWWALFLGGCFGGTITMLGSPANIVALSLLEKHHSVKINLFYWSKIGLIIGLMSTGIAWIELIFLSKFMPHF